MGDFPSDQFSMHDVVAKARAMYAETSRPTLFEELEEWQRASWYIEAFSVLTEGRCSEYRDALKSIAYDANGNPRCLSRQTQPMNCDDLPDYEQRLWCICCGARHVLEA